MNDLLEIAYRATARSKVNTRYRMAALVVRGGAVLSLAHNTNSCTYPDSTARHGHAEVRALRPHLNLRGATIIVVRSNRRVSKPCDRCVAAIRAAGIKKMVYVDWNGEVVIENV